MSTTIRRMIAILAALGLLAVGFASGAVAQDEGGEETGEDSGDESDNGLSEEQMDYVAISGTVACYNKRVSDADEANKAIEAFLASEGMTLLEYQEMEKKFRGDTSVQGAIKEEMALCDTKVLAMPEEDEEDAELTEEEKKELEEAEKDKDKWSYSKKVYKGTASKGGVSGGRIVWAFKRNGKNAKGNFTGKIKGQSFALGLSGTRKGNKLTLRGSSGAKNSARVKVTFKKKSGKYSTARGNFSGKINGRKVSFSFSAKARSRR